MTLSLTSMLEQLEDGYDANEVLQEIISTRYRKFHAIYWIIKKIEDLIDKIRYERTEDDNSLKVVIHMKKECNQEDIDNAVFLIEDSVISNGQSIKTKKNNHKIIITIEQDEINI